MVAVVVVVEAAEEDVEPTAIVITVAARDTTHVTATRKEGEHTRMPLPTTKRRTHFLE